MHFGMLSVSGRSRLPNPPASIIASIFIKSLIEKPRQVKNKAVDSTYRFPLFILQFISLDGKFKKHVLRNTHQNPVKST
jgi:hypothetical protein